ncbi:MAG: potassium channel family protein [Mycobacterium sp.]
MLETRLQRWENKAEWALAGCAVVFLALYSYEVLGQPTGRTMTIVSWLLTLLYLPFVIDYLIRIYLAENRVRWFLRHPLDLAVVTLPFLQPLRFLRLVALVRILQRAFGDAIQGRVLYFTAFGAVLLAYVASLAELKYERYAPGSHITNFGDALWWAITTLSTVGYGDFVPVTPAGRIIAALLMIGGISLIGVVTATVAHWIVTTVAADDGVQQAATAAHIEQLQAEMVRLESMIMNQTEGQRN